MRTLKAGENIDFLKMEYVFFLLLHRDVSAWPTVLVSDKIDMPFFHLLENILRRIHPIHHIIQLFGR